MKEAVSDAPGCGERLDVKWSTYPHVVLVSGDLAWTSVQLTLQKPAWKCKTGCGWIAGARTASDAQCSGGKPTRERPYQPQGNAAPALWNPLSPGTVGLSQVVAMGDSIVWGNGDRPGFKLLILLDNSEPHAPAAPSL
ncbi:hypothetical protein AciX8_3723 [Granulicella mallensis MP5ACTX8]|uniref:Uncharacterized protein n=1 Tax=Granulicella mallensis (strain ATCC BAA-1857 / DSM 23137 / MP5ACTX8) TaxID=682795 RepID=G8NZI1_GRAMM|nr:hypothetical protein AciX8_3723 [Granulicella mallensis MP5ACTX8]